MRLLWIFLALAVLFLIPFAIWGGALESMLTVSGTVAWMKGYGPVCRRVRYAPDVIASGRAGAGGSRRQCVRTSPSAGC